MITPSAKTGLPTLLRLAPFAAACLWTSTSPAQNLVSNGTFEAEVIDPWWTHASEEAMAAHTVEVIEGRMCSTILDGEQGENIWDLIIGLSELHLVAGQNYHVTFSASSSVGQEVRMKTGLGDAPYTDYFLKKAQLTPEPQVFDFTYLNLKEDAAAQAQFQIGGTPGQVCFDDIVIEAVDAPTVPTHVTPSLTGYPLKAYPSVVKMGTAVDTPAFLSSPLHNSIVAGEFSMITPANAMKMNIIQPVQGMFDFVETDALLAWADENGLEFHGHPLVWHTQVPAWVTDDETLDRDAMIEIMYAHIDALLDRYVGKMPYWDVVNEAIDKNSGDAYTFRSTVWHDRIGDDFIDLAFQRARMKEPTAKLLYNDYNIEQMGNAKADRVFELVSDMKARNIPIDGIGFQSHYFVEADGSTSSGVPNMAKIRANMDRYAEIGVEVHITECDFRIGKPLDDAKQQVQSKFYADLLQTCIDAPNCSHFTLWGLSDFDSWVPSTFAEYDFAHIFDAALVAKPAYHALTDVFANYDPELPAGGSGGNSGEGAGGTSGEGAGGDANSGAGASGGADSGAGANSGVGANSGAGPNPGSGKKSSGCSIEPSRLGGNTPWQFLLSGALGVSIWIRRNRRATSNS